MQEVWKDIKGYEGIYQVSNFGRVKSLDRITPHGHRIKGKILTTQNTGSYYQVCLTKFNHSKSISVHRLVAQTFISNPNNLPEVNHKDENKLNNNADNLEWCDRKYNNNYGSRLIQVSNTLKGRTKSIEHRRKISQGRKLYNLEHLHEVTCVNCGVKFKAYDKKAKYCSKKCKDRSCK